MGIAHLFHQNIMTQKDLKPVEWIGSSLEDLKNLPNQVCRKFGYAIYLAQMGTKYNSSKPLKGFNGTGVLEIVQNFDTDTYRAVYTVKFAEVVYVLHIFQKKSKKGIATPKKEIDLINKRLQQAQEHYQQNYS